MALASNTKEQIAKRLKQDIEKLAPELTCAAKAAADGQPMIEIKDGATVVALAAIKRKSFNGFNIVAEISSSAGEGLPEHDAFLIVKDDQSLVRMAKLAKAAAGVGCASLKVAASAAPAEADMTDANTTEIPNDARLGAVGN
jgi:hypothetical protein